MKINNMAKIDSKKGEFIILVDNLSEGISVLGQYKTADEAIQNLSNSYGQNTAIVKLVEFSISENT
jgi:hypothetical protein